jgi:hypothetical protein
MATTLRTPARSAAGGRSVTPGTGVMIGGGAIFAGSWLPLATWTVAGLSLPMVPSALRSASALFGLMILSLGAAVAFGSPELRRGAATAAVGTAVPGALGYLVTILGGLIGYPIPNSLGLTVRVTYSPGVGLVLALAGCAAATVAAIRAFQIGGRTAPDRRH